METVEFNIETLPVKITYVGETVRDNAWKCDQWRVELSNKLGMWSTDYFTGLGLRTKPRTSWDSPRPKKPTIADVLYSLFTDASAADYNFSDWCDTFGYSDDSIKALNTYKACLEIATALRKYFSPDQRKAIQSIIEEM
jgi:hypothetical protein